MFQRQKISSSPFSICFVKIYKNPSDNCYIFSSAHKPKKHQVHYSGIIKQISQCQNFRKTNFVEEYQQNLFSYISFLVHINYPLIFFFSFDIFNSGYPPKCVLHVWSSAKVYILKNFWYCSSAKANVSNKMKKMKFY